MESTVAKQALIIESAYAQPMDRVAIRQRITDLIGDFKANYEKHKKELEANTETKLVEPLFAILGWTTKDFTKREHATRRGRPGYVDYAFKIDERAVFYLEVKKLGTKLEKEADTQVISYALSKRILFAVSTNFESLKIFCVEQENAANNVFRVFKTPQDYVDNLQDLLFLHKESFEQNLLLKKAEDEGRLKKRISIDIPLLNDLMSIRNMVANDIEKRYPRKYDLNEREEIIQRIIDRLIFIRKCEDIGINPDGLVLEEISHNPYGKAHSTLKEIFKRYNDVYNGGLFAVGYDNDCDKVVIDGEIVQRLVSLLYESKDGQYVYDFDYIDADVLGQIYEQYLGKILSQTKTGKSKLRSGQAHKKEQGIYYTPTYIVEFIVKNALLGLPKTKMKTIGALKLLDPACGSGSFLIKAFDYFVSARINSRHGKQGRLDDQGVYSIKTEILKNNLYGVDLDRKAVEITKLNLLLKAAEKGRRLPIEVDAHIRYGNSLVESEDIVGFSAFKWDGDFREGSFDVIVGNPPYVSWDRIDRRERAAFETGRYLDMSYHVRTKHEDSQPNYYLFFLKRAESLLSNDGVLSFILPQEWLYDNHAKDFRNHLLDRFGKIDIVQFRPEFRVFKSSEGVVGTNSLVLLLQKHGDKTLTHTYVDEMDETKVRDTLAKGSFGKRVTKPFEEVRDTIWTFVEPSLNNLQDKIGKDSVRFDNKDFFDVCGGFQPPIDQAQFYELGQREYDELSSNEKDYVFRLVYDSKDIQRYVVQADRKYWIVANELDSEDDFKNACPRLYDILQRRLGGRRKGKWWHFPHIRNFPLIKTSQMKLLSPRTAEAPSFALDDEKSVFKGTNTMIVSKQYDPRYVLAILNSKLSDFWYTRFGYDYHGGRTKKYEPEKARRYLIPIKNTRTDSQEELIRLVNREIQLRKHILEIGDKKTSEGAKVEGEITKADARIDELVFALYGLTKEEIRMVNESLDLCHE